MKSFLHLRYSSRYSFTIALVLSSIFGVGLPGAAYASTPSAAVPGCIAGANYSVTTGQPCNTSTPISAIPGCLAGFAFSTVTGQACASAVSAPLVRTVTTTVKTTPTGSSENTQTEVSSASTAQFKALPIALLSGGSTRAGATVPISYLQVMNQSSSTIAVKGFWVHEDGSTPDAAIIGFSSVDGKGTSRASTGGFEGNTPMVNGAAYVPSTAVFAPHEMKLFTLKAQLSATASQYAGTSLMLNVTGIDTPAQFTTPFPIRGTTWTIGY